LPWLSDIIGKGQLYMLVAEKGLGPNDLSPYDSTPNGA